MAMQARRGLLALMEIPCQGDPEAWFPHSTDSEGKEAARSLCRYRCPARLACLKAAQDLRPLDGVWGGIYMTGNKARDELKILRAIEHLELHKARTGGGDA